MFNMKVVEPMRLDADSKFKFRCYPGIKCFTRCCSNIDIMLTPYDVLRLKNRLGMTSGEFLAAHTLMRIDPKSSHPYAYLKMGDDGERRCPFVVVPSPSATGPEDDIGCTIYADRPVSCRYYPVGQATLKKGIGSSGQGIHEEFYFFVKEEHCAGYEEPTEWTVQAFREDQGAEHYDAMNREWKEILMRRNIPGKTTLEPKKQKQFFLASYDLDNFKKYVFESRFLDIFDIDPDEVEKIKSDEVSLMKFAFKYIKYVLMLEETLKVKEGARKGSQTPFPSDIK